MNTIKLDSDTPRKIAVEKNEDNRPLKLENIFSNIQIENNYVDEPMKTIDFKRYQRSASRT